jgi:hypothetical protein
MVWLVSPSGLKERHLFASAYRMEIALLEVYACVLFYVTFNCLLKCESL